LKQKQKQQQKQKQKQNRGSKTSTWVTIREGATKDMQGWSLAGRDKRDAVRISTFTPDRTRPALQFFSLDTNVGIVRFLVLLIHHVAYVFTV
jgi:hypothetical protein